jgi:hypothetical protein
VGREVVEQVQDLVAERHLEVAPTVRDRVGDLEGEREPAGQPPASAIAPEAGS